MTAGFRALGETQRQIDRDREQNDRTGVLTWEYVHESVKLRYDSAHQLDMPYAPENLVQYLGRDMPDPIFATSLKARAARVSSAVNLSDLKPGPAAQMI